MFSVKSHFIGSFKIGDNISYNLDVLETLYKVSIGGNSQKEILCKPITTIIVSIIEAVLHDFFCVRAKTHTIEGIQGISDDTLSEIRDKKIEELNVYIDQARKYNILKVENNSFYEELHELRKIRNRIHIQNVNNHHPSDEIFLFNDANKSKAEKKLEYLLKVMSKEYGRSNHRHCNSDFKLPWNAHYKKNID